MTFSKKFLVSIPLVFVLLGAGCGEIRDEGIPQNKKGVDGITTSEEQKLEPQTVIASSTTKGWNVLTNNKYGYKIEYPCTWKVGQYTDNSGQNDGVVAIALDPKRVATSKEYETLDAAPGQIWLYRGVYETRGSEARAMGMGGMMARYRKITYSGKNAPNPWWQNKTTEEYNFTNSNNPYTLQMYYPNTDASSTQRQTMMQRIIDSFQFVK